MTTRTITTWAALLALGLLAASCSNDNSGIPEGECIDDGDCGTDGSMQACVDGTCQDVDCFVSSDCPLASHCAQGACVDGCGADDDCLSGYHCDEAGSCVASDCRSTVLDCYAGQFCENGTCVDAGPPLCSPCNSQNMQDAIIDDNGTAWDPFDDQLIGYHSCGGVSSFCLAYAQGEPELCWTACETSDDCPAAFECTPIVDMEQNVLGQSCIGPCDG